MNFLPPARSSSRKTVLALTLTALLSGCQMIPTDTGSFMPSSNPVTVDTVTRGDRLARLARQQHPRILQTYGGEYSDAKLERMVAKVVGSLTLDEQNTGAAYRITILNSPNVNAFALPGGYLYVTRGLLALANDSAELAAVLAPEWWLPLVVITAVVFYALGASRSPPQPAASLCNAPLPGKDIYDYVQPLLPSSP